jgi:caffeoyl-CoA O-methyltransferase
MIRSEHVDAYLEGLRPERSPLMQEMEAVGERDDVPIVPWETGRFLATLIRALDPLAVLEVGTAIGYSTLHIAEALGRGRIVTIERDPDRAAQARDFLERGGVADKVEIVEADALDAIKSLEGPFDVLFLDATKWESTDYVALANPLLTERAVLLVDNLLMSGEVALPADAETRWRTESLEAARAFNAWLLESDEWLGSVVPLGDGLGFAVRR